jgi:hypothetical protein
MERSMGWSVLASSGVVLTAAYVVVAASAAPAPNRAKSFMRLKLDHAQQAVEAIAVEDYEGISQHAQRIALLTEDENWQVMQTVEYKRHSDDFRRTARLLAEAGQKKNLDGAVLAYMQMTMQCVHCHRHVRAQGNPEKK